MEATGHRIPFVLPGECEVNGYICINRSGWFGYEYACLVLDQQIKEVTDDLKNVDGNTYECDVGGTVTTPCIDDANQPVVYYTVKVTRCSDGVSTTVHRRFRDFADMNSQIKQNLKGHQIWSSLPPLPDKTLKFLVDHNDPAFISERQQGLHTYLGIMVNMPHVNEMTCAKSFLGLMDKVTEYSTVFHTPALGLSVEPGASIVVTGIQTPSLSGNIVRCGDALSKIAGVPIAGTSFNAVVQYLKSYPRPLIVHLTRVVGANYTPHVKEQEQSPPALLPASGAYADRKMPSAGATQGAQIAQSPATQPRSGSRGGVGGGVSGSGSGWTSSLSPAPYAAKEPSSKQEDAASVQPPVPALKPLVADKPRTGIAVIDPAKRAAFLGVPAEKEFDTMEDQSI